MSKWWVLTFYLDDGPLGRAVRWIERQKALIPCRFGRHVFLYPSSYTSACFICGKPHSP